MAYVEIAINELRDPEVAVRVEDEIYEAAETAHPEGQGERASISVLDEGRSLDIEVEALGWTARRSVPPRPRPGQVRRAVEELLDSVGLR